MNNQNTSVSSISEAVSKSEVVLIAIPPTSIFEVLPQLNNVTGKIVIDATNSVRQSPEPYKTVYHCLMEKTQGDVVKCFNSTGFENILNPTYQGKGIDMFMAGESDLAKKV
ncbi:MAG: NAD(P)-binding domain-containing protein, partial [Bacteroidetes bacterium]|nr:NAD(P)-binding domain-containing protein [Bacteroidota bacterium]